MRRWATWLLAGGIALAAAGAARVGWTVLADGSAPSADAEMLTLSLSRSQAEVAVPAAVLDAPPEALFLMASRVSNPAGRGFGVAAYLVPRGRPPVRIGVAGIFPSGQGGVFTLPWRSAIRRAAPVRGAKLVLRLEPIRPNERGDISLDVLVSWTKPCG